MNEVENHDFEKNEEQVESPEEITDNMADAVEEQTEPDAVETEDNGEKEKRKSFFGNRNADKEKQLKEQIVTLQSEKEELNDKFLRLYSEFDNYKKRTSREKLDLISTASEQVIVNLLPVIDDFERAIAANQSATDIDSIKAGFDLIYQKLQQLLKHFSVEEISAKGEVFDTDLHEAVTHFPAQNEEDKGKVMDVTQKGYKMKDKVIRYSKVVVAN